MIGVEAVATPRIVPEHHIGAHGTYGLGHPPLHRDVVMELAVGVLQELDVAAPEQRGRAPLLALAQLDQRGGVD